jgi:amino acid transporter/nucleotide-binding universal stress UspA family protein
LEDRHESTLVRELGLTEALAVGLGTMIGAGIFVLSAIAARQAGPAAALSYVAAGLVALPTAMIVSELATGMPRAGGSYHLISRALGPLAGAVVGPGNWLGLTFANGFYLIGLAQYAAYFLPLPTWITALTAGVFFVYLNYRGAKLSGVVQNYIVALLVLILALFVGRGLFHIAPGLHKPFVPNGWGAVIGNVGLIIVSFTGFEKISTIAEEVKRPERNLPLAIIGSVVIATFLYGGILFVATGIISYQIIADLQAPLVEAASRIMGGVGIVGMSLAALLATASSANAAIMASSRINFAMGRDGILPGWFNEIHPRFLTPHRSVLVSGALAIILAMSGEAEVLAEISSALFMVSYFLLALSLLVMRRTKPTWYRPAFKIPLYPGLAILGGILALAVIGTMKHSSQVAGIGLVGLSIGWYIIWGRRKTPVEGELFPWLARERPLEAMISNIEQAVEAERREIMVPVANPATVRSLVRLAACMAQGHERTEINVVKIVSFPVSLPLSIANTYLERDHEEQANVLRLAEMYGSESGVRVKTRLLAAYGIASGILEAAKHQTKTGLILLGWHGPFTLSRVGNSIDKEVLREAPCNVAVFLDRHLEKVQRVLVPAGGGPHARFGLRLATNLARGNGAELVVLRVAPELKDGTLEAEEEAVEKLITAEVKSLDSRVTGRVIQSPLIVGSILSEAQKGYDLLVIGASEEWFLRNWLFGSIPDVVAERAPCSVLLVKKYEARPVSSLRRALKRGG